MSIDFTISYDIAFLIALVLPVITFCLLYLISSSFRNRAEGLKRYLSYLVTPPALIASENISGKDDESKQAISWRNDKVRIYFLYAGMILFLASFVLGEFYEVMLDLSLPVRQGSTGQYREIVNVTIMSVFRLTWLGSLPWIGAMTYHETWDWIFFTAAFADNSAFLSTTTLILFLYSMGAGFVFLLPLISKSIRNAFIPSMFSFITGMIIFSKAAASCLGYVLGLLFLDKQLEYITLAATGNMIPELPLLCPIVLLVTLLMFALFTFAGRRLWKRFYNDSRSLKQFTMYLGVVFWLGVFIPMILM